MKQRRQFVQGIWRLAEAGSLVAAIAAWWFVLRSDARVLDAVDSVSYVVMVFSLWRAIRSLARRRGSVLFRFGGSEVAEPGEQGCVGVAGEVGGEAPESVCQDILTGGEYGGSAHRAEIGQLPVVGSRPGWASRRRIRIVCHRAPR
jgi:hypothetical protein